jgi:D-isomer specific 2-hydroxyacid dehydrogenase, NAD binding domain
LPFRHNDGNKNAVDADSRNNSRLMEMLRCIGPELLAVDGIKRYVSPSRTLIFAHIHCLPSYSKLLGYMIDVLRFVPSQMFVVPKAYSTIPETLHELKAMGVGIANPNGVFQVGYYNNSAALTLNAACRYAAKLIDNSRVAERAVLLDDGGSLTEFWHKHQLHERIKTVSVQQTTSGIYREPTNCKKIIKINVAGSAAKRWFESWVIAAGVTRKLGKIRHQLARRRIGIVGYGAIGKAIATAMKEYTDQDNIRIYDSALNVRAEHFKNTSSLRSLVNKSDFILGCTGRNCFASAEHILKGVENSITFVSCSSRDVEFLTLLRSYAQPIDNAFGEIELQAGKVHKVLNGGFPINFDRVHEYETGSEISLTRALTLSGVLQGLGHLSYNRRDPIMIPLGPKAQRFTVETWLRLNEKNYKQFGVSQTDFHDPNWWERES